MLPYLPPDRAQQEVAAVARVAKAQDIRGVVSGGLKLPVQETALARADDSQRHVLQPGPAAEREFQQRRRARQPAPRHSNCTASLFFLRVFS